jgi:hypothetical protein
VICTRSLLGGWRGPIAVRNGGDLLLSEQEGSAHGGFQLVEPSGLVGEMERFPGVVLAEIETQADDVGQLEFDAAAVIDSEFGYLVAVINRCTRWNKTGELHTAGGERADARTFRRGVEQKVVKALMNGHGTLDARDIQIAVVVGVAEFVAHEAIGVEREAEGQTESVVDGDSDRISQLIDSVPQAGVTESRDASTDGKFAYLRRRQSRTREQDRQDSPQSHFTLLSRPSGYFIFIAARHRAEVNQFAVDGLFDRRGGWNEGSANGILF